MTALHHEVHGRDDAPVLVLSSSLGTTCAMWAPQLEPLSERFRVVTYDMRGHGRSPVPPGPYEIGDLGADVLALLNALEVERAAFCGLSIGGMIGQWLGIHAADRIDRLILCCSSSYAPPAEAWAERARTVREAGTTAAIADAVVGRWLTAGFATAHPEIRDWLHAMLIAQPANGYAECCGAIERMDLRSELQTITAPTLVLGATDDPSLPPDPHSDTIAAGIRGARAVRIDDAAHLASVEQAHTMTRLILEHLEQP